MQALEVIFEDDFILVIGKPGGMVVNRAGSVKEETLQDWLASRYNFETREYEKAAENDEWDEVNWQAFYDRNGIVHRLDKETSGVMVVAKTPEVYIDLLKQFREREVQKTYVALVHGEMPQGEGVMEGEVGRLPWNRERFGVMAGGREATTIYKVTAKYQKNNQDFSLLELEPKTGRTHQIRIHLKAINRPIVGDEFYAGRKTARNDRTWCPRLFLHAKRLELRHPISKEKLKFELELPEDLLIVIENLVSLSL